MIDPLLAICSHCNLNGYECRCDRFHPNVPMHVTGLPSENIAKNIEIKVDKDFKLNKEERQSILDYVYKRAGYISPEFDKEFLDLIKRIEEFDK